jgi:hypothetical protein
MKAIKLKQQETNASIDVVQAKGHQVPEMQLAYVIVLAVVGMGFLVFVFSDGLLPALDTVCQALPVYAVILGFLMVFMQLNHQLADQLSDYIARLQSHQSEVVDYLCQQMDFWRQLFSSFITINPRPEISFFDRLSDLLGLTQLPLLNAPNAFRS